MFWFFFLSYNNRCTDYCCLSLACIILIYVCIINNCFRILLTILFIILFILIRIFFGIFCWWCCCNCKLIYILFVLFTTSRISWFIIKIHFCNRSFGIFFFISPLFFYIFITFLIILISRSTTYISHFWKSFLKNQIIIGFWSG